METDLGEATKGAQGLEEGESIVETRPAQMLMLREKQRAGHIPLGTRYFVLPTTGETRAILSRREFTP